MTKEGNDTGNTANVELSELRERVVYLQAAARELAAQRDMMGERAANLAGELARLRNNTMLQKPEDMEETKQ